MRKGQTDIKNIAARIAENTENILLEQNGCTFNVDLLTCSQNLSGKAGRGVVVPLVDSRTFITLPDLCFDFIESPKRCRRLEEHTPDLGSKFCRKTQQC